VPLALRCRPGAQDHLPASVDFDPAVLSGVGGAACPLHEGTEPNPDRVATFGATLALFPSELFKIDQINRHAQRRPIVTGVIEGSGVGLVGEGVGGDDIGESHLDGAESRLAGEDIYGTFDGKRRLWTSGPPI
jgi:hypothetical protein